MWFCLEICVPPGLLHWCQATLGSPLGDLSSPASRHISVQPSSETCPAPTHQLVTAAHSLWSLNISPWRSSTPMVCFHHPLHPLRPLFSLQILLCPPLSSAGPVLLLRAAKQADSTFCPQDWLYADKKQ